MSLGEDAGNCHLVGWEGGLKIVSALQFVEKASKDTHDSIEMF